MPERILRKKSEYSANDNRRKIDRDAVDGLATGFRRRLVALAKSARAFDEAGMSDRLCRLKVGEAKQVSI